MIDKTTLPAEDRVAQMTRDYLNRSGMSVADFARRIGYAYQTVHHFLDGNYSRGAARQGRRIDLAVLDFMQRFPIESDALAAQNIYETGAVTVMRQVFARLLERPGVYLAYAPPGSGKTDIARKLIADHNALDADGKPTHDSFIFRIYCRACIGPRDLMRRVAAACGSEAPISIDRIFHNLRWDFRGKRVVLYFDEAQHLSLDSFETVRELLDEEPHFSLCFAGSHALEAIFDNFAGKIEQLERRIVDKIRLPAVTADEAAGILRSELPGVALDAAMIRQQIEMATVPVLVGNRTQRYLSIGRLMAAIREIREGLAEQEPRQVEVESPDRIEVVA
jgi:DNA transposition AAA+ family ATPase